MIKILLLLSLFWLGCLGLGLAMAAYDFWEVLNNDSSF